MDVLVTLVGRIAAAREAEVALGREQEQEVSVRIRAEHHKMLDDIRKRISEIECEMSSAASPIKLRLQGDLNFSSRSDTGAWMTCVHLDKAS